MFDIPVINFAEDIALKNNGISNESAFATKMGFPSNPSISESVIVYRDLEIANYVDSKIHIPHVSSKESIELISKYKKLGLNVTAEVTPHHLGLTEERLFEYDTHAKVAPPLRTASDQEAVTAGLIDGTIDCIATDHAPHTIEEKEMDFIHAPCGMIGLESAFGLSHTMLKNAGASMEQVIQWLTSGPASVMGWELKAFEINKPADIVIIDPEMEWDFCCR